MTQPEIEKMDRLSGPDPFGFVRALGRKLRASESHEASEVKYLWLCLSKDGLSGSACGCDAPSAPPTQEHWLNVVDEAASLGVSRMVVSAHADLSLAPELWEVCRWAQDAHGMTIGIHLLEDCVGKDVVARLKGLDLSRLILFVREDCHARLSGLEQDGIRVRIAKPLPDGEPAVCEMPHQMLFVNRAGQLYTCGMVEDNQGYWLGNIFEGFFAKILGDEKLPHAVPADIQTADRGCEGCPPLLARFFYEE